jgi:hypothetical protein
MGVGQPFHDSECDLVDIVHVRAAPMLCASPDVDNAADRQGLLCVPGNSGREVPHDRLNNRNEPVAPTVLNARG